MEVQLNNTFSHNIKIISWEQYFHALYRDRCTQVVEEYNVQLSYSDFSMTEPNNAEDASYSRDYFQVKELKNPMEETKLALLNLLDKTGIKPKHLNDDLQESVEMAVINAMEQFAVIDFCALVKLDKNNYMLAPLSKDEVVIKMLDILNSAIIVFKPFSFVRFTHYGDSND